MVILAIVMRNESLGVKNEDESVLQYLTADIPERVQLVRERARCISLPYIRESPSGEQDSSE